MMVKTEEKVDDNGENLRDETSGASDKLDSDPNEIFKRMVVNDKKQNKRLSANLSISNGLTSKKVAGDVEKRSSIRFIVCTLGLITLSVSQMSRMILNQTIKDMVDPAMCQIAAANNSSAPNNHQQQSTTPMDPILYIITSDPSVESYRPTEDPLYEYIGGDDMEEVSTDSDLDSEQTNPMISQDKFCWTMKEQSYLLGGFFYGYALLMIPGGRLAEVHGAKYVVLLSIAGSGVINLATPWMARNSFVLLMISRVTMGVIQSGVFPAMYALFAKWLTPTETSIFAPLIKLNLRLGMFLGSILPGVLADWPSVFYFTGFVCAIFSLLWLVVASSSPEGNNWVSESELKHIMRKKRKPEMIMMTTRTVNNQEQSKQVPVKIKPPESGTPWIRILTHPSVIGLILVKVTFNYAVDFFSILVPSYLTYVHHASKEMVSSITSIMFSLQIVLIFFIGWLAKVMILRRPFGLSKTAIRKIFQGLANWGMALMLVLITFNDGMILYVAFLLQVMSLLSMFTAGGETMLPYDLSDQYPATIMAIANSVANFSGVTTTFLAGLILGDQSGSGERWNILMYLIAGANLLGGLAFILLVKAEPIDFSSKSGQKLDIEQQDSVVPPSAPIEQTKDKLDLGLTSEQQ